MSFFLHQQRDLIELCFNHVWVKENFLHTAENEVASLRKASNGAKSRRKMRTPTATEPWRVPEVEEESRDDDDDVAEEKAAC